MDRVTGIGGIFFKARDPRRLLSWYQRHLGLVPERDHDSVSFPWRSVDDTNSGYTVWAPFPEDTSYFDPSTKPFMVNFRVAYLSAMLVLLREEGIEVDDRVEEYEFGRFGWIMDPEGNRIELWEPRSPPHED